MEASLPCVLNIVIIGVNKVEYYDKIVSFFFIYNATA